MLGILNSGNAFRRLDDDEKTYIRRMDVAGHGGRAMVLVSEPGLYRLIQGSDKPAAREFDRWVRHTVLPAIRKDGMYVMGEEKVTSGEMSEEGLPIPVVLVAGSLDDVT